MQRYIVYRNKKNGTVQVLLVPEWNISFPEIKNFSVSSSGLVQIYFSSFFTVASEAALEMECVQVYPYCEIQKKADIDEVKKFIRNMTKSS